MRLYTHWTWVGLESTEDRLVWERITFAIGVFSSLSFLSRQKRLNNQATHYGYHTSFFFRFLHLASHQIGKEKSFLAHYHPLSSIPLSNAIPFHPSSTRTSPPQSQFISTLFSRLSRLFSPGYSSAFLFLVLLSSSACIPTHHTHLSLPSMLSLSLVIDHACLRIHCFGFSLPCRTLSHRVVLFIL